MEDVMGEDLTLGAQPIEVGDLAPDFSLPAAQGGSVVSGQAVQKGPVLLWFAPGMV
jgi:peroxiredoxin